MKAVTLLLVAVLLSSGCTSNESGVKMGVASEGEKLTITVPTTLYTTTTHKSPPIANVDDLSGLVSTTTSSTTTTYTMITASTTTTVTLILNTREYTTWENSSFYLTGSETVRGVDYYTIDYNTSDNKWGTITFTNSTLIDNMELGILRPGPGIGFTAYLKESDFVKKHTPPNATAMLLGGGLENRTYAGYWLSLDSLQSDRVKISMASDTDFLLMDLREGDIAYYNGLEVGVIDTRLPGANVLIWVKSDSDEYSSHSGVRYCGRDYTRFSNAKALLVDGSSSTVYNGMNMTVRSFEGGVVTLAVSKGDLKSDFQISCGSSLSLFNQQVNLLWVGEANGRTAKLLVHSVN